MICEETSSVSNRVFDKAIGMCLETVVEIDNVPFRCLLDTGAQISTITESFFNDNFKEISGCFWISQDNCC